VKPLTDLDKRLREDLARRQYEEACRWWLDQLDNYTESPNPKDGWTWQ